MHFLDLNTNILTIMTPFLISKEGLNLRVALVREPWDMNASDYPLLYVSKTPLIPHYLVEINLKVNIEENMRRCLLQGQLVNILKNQIKLPQKKFRKPTYLCAARVELFRMAYRNLNTEQPELGKGLIAYWCQCGRADEKGVQTAFHSWKLVGKQNPCSSCITMKERKNKLMKELEHAETNVFIERQVYERGPARIAEAEAKLLALRAKYGFEKIEYEKI